MIQVQDLSKSFTDPKRGTRLAVDRVSFDVRGGEVFGLLGPNGAGKTTTLRLLATLLKPSSGTAVLNGFDVNPEPGKVRTQIGFLSGDMGLYGRLTPPGPPYLRQQVPHLLFLRPQIIFRRLVRRHDARHPFGYLHASLLERLNFLRIIRHQPHRAQSKKSENARRQLVAS